MLFVVELLRNSTFKVRKGCETKGRKRIIIAFSNQDSPGDSLDIEVFSEVYDEVKVFFYCWYLIQPTATVSLELFKDY